MSDFKARLNQEIEELVEKLKKLESFIDSDKFASIPEMQRQLLLIQAPAMRTYLHVLGLRIALLE